MIAWLHGSRSVFHRGPRAVCMHSGSRSGIYSDEPIATTKCYCLSVACQQWTTQSNTNYNNGLGNPATSVRMCQAACLGNPACTGFDWDARQPVTVGRQCWLSGSWSGARGSLTGVTHYVINRNCLGKLKHSNFVCINTEASWFI